MKMLPITIKPIRIRGATGLGVGCPWGTDFLEGRRCGVKDRVPPPPYGAHYVSEDIHLFTSKQSLDYYTPDCHFGSIVFSLHQKNWWNSLHAAVAEVILHKV